MPRQRGHYTLFLMHGGVDEKTGEHYCPACGEIAPLIDAYEKRHPEVNVERHDITTMEWKAKAWAPRLTPTLIVLKPNGKWCYYEGGITEAEVISWVSYHIPHGW